MRWIHSWGSSAGTATASPHPEQKHCAFESNTIKARTGFWYKRWVRRGVTDVLRHDSFCSASIQRARISSSILRFARTCFSNCRSLTSVTFESNSKLHRIEEFAFQGSDLKTIVIPTSIEVVCKYCFSNYESLTSVICESDSKF
jgi:hypothetical protein